MSTSLYDLIGCRSAQPQLSFDPPFSINLQTVRLRNSLKQFIICSNINFIITIIIIYFIIIIIIIAGILTERIRYNLLSTLVSDQRNIEDANIVTYTDFVNQ